MLPACVACDVVHAAACDTLRVLHVACRLLHVAGCILHAVLFCVAWCALCVARCVVCCTVQALGGRTVYVHFMRTVHDHTADDKDNELHNRQ